MHSDTTTQASPLDILCKVAAAESDPSSTTSSPSSHFHLLPHHHHHHQQQQQQPPLLPPPHLPPILPALQPQITQPSPPPPFRLSSSAPSNPSPLQHSVIPLAPLAPLAQPHQSNHHHHHHHHHYHLQHSHLPKVSPPPPPSPSQQLRQQQQQQQQQQPPPVSIFDPPLTNHFQRNLSAPSLSQPCIPPASTPAVAVPSFSNGATPPLSAASELPYSPHTAFHPSTQAIPVPARPVTIPAARFSGRYAPLPAIYSSPLPESAPSSYGSASTGIYASSPPLRRALNANSVTAIKGVSGGGRTIKMSGRRDSYTRFTAEEEAMLLDGVRVFGVGNWKKILNSYTFHWKRTAVDLKDKYRNIMRARVRRMNASSASDLSSAGSEGEGGGNLALSPPTSRASPMQCSPLRAQAVTPATFSPLSTPSGSVEERGGDNVLSKKDMFRN